MKYEVGQSVILLDTELKPAVNAVIKEVNTETRKYLIEYRLRKEVEPEELWVPQERLSTAVDMLPAVGKH